MGAAEIGGRHDPRAIGSCDLRCCVRRGGVWLRHCWSACERTQALKLAGAMQGAVLVMDLKLHWNGNLRPRIWLIQINADDARDVRWGLLSELPVQEHGPDLIPVPIGPRGRGHITEINCGVEWARCERDRKLICMWLATR